MLNPGRRRACVLIPLFSIRTPTGWGLGEIPDLIPFARWAAAAGFQAIQLLPVGEVVGGETSPYAAASSFAIDPVYFGLEQCEDFQAAGGRTVLDNEDRNQLEVLAQTPAVAWTRLRPIKTRAAHKAFARFFHDEWTQRSARAQVFARFREEQAAWLDDYALFAVLHDRFHRSWLDWPPALRNRNPAALASLRQHHGHDILFKEWLQWQLDQQWRLTRAACAQLGVALKGDLPFMVSHDSADVWASRENFRTDLRVGTPPDSFSAEGQDWGLPAYDWEAMERNDFSWMRSRAARIGALYDLYRVDHVIGLYRTFYRDADGTCGFLPPDETAQVQNGERVIRILAEAGEVVAEDLGMVPPFLRPSLVRLGIPGYRVLRWEKDELRDENGIRLIYRDPATWPALSVATSGTHDIETHAEWYDALCASERAALAAVPGLEALARHPRFDETVRDLLLWVLYAAPSELVVVPFQDALGTRERINVPGTVNEHNWIYRMPMNVDALEADSATLDRLARLSRDTGRGAFGLAGRAARR